MSILRPWKALSSKRRPNLTQFEYHPSKGTDPWPAQYFHICSNQSCGLGTRSLMSLLKLELKCHFKTAKLQFKMVEHTLLNAKCILFAKHMTWEYIDAFKLQVISRNNCIVTGVLTIILMLCNTVVSIWILFLFLSPHSVILHVEDPFVS